MVGGLAPSMPALGFTDLRLRVRQREDGIIIRCKGFVRRTRTISRRLDPPKMAEVLALPAC
jgi:hypothetical protein